MKRLPIAIVVIALAWIAALLQRGASLGWDEVEFFRATRWVAEGQVPFRDFWEHHTPLQWFLFAPVAFFADGAGTESVIAMRWAQLPLWIAAMALLLRIAREAGAGVAERWTALAALLASASFVRKALEYRVDTIGNALYVCALALLLVERRASARRQWFAFGAVMSLAVLANMRLAPLVIFTALLATFWNREERRWRFQPSALAMFAGVFAVAGLYLAYVLATGSMAHVIEDLIRYNAAPGRERLEVATFGVTLLAPLWSRDLAAIALWLAAIAGASFALRELRRPGPLTFVALLFIASIATVRMLEVHYEYHFQTAYLLMLPLAASALTRHLWRGVAIAVIAVGLVLNVANTLPGFGRALAYQDRLMTDVDRLTTPDEHVLDGVGMALRRKPSYRYWFLPTGLRWMAAEKLVEPYDAREMAADPPGAILFDFRLYRWMEIFPSLGKYAVRHYLPLYRDLWIPGMTAIAQQRPRRFVWSAPRAGTYRVHTSELLVNHPWFRSPLQYALIGAPLAARYAIPLERLPPARNIALQWVVDGVALPAGTRTITVKKQARVELLAMTFSGTAGIVLVPEGVGTICIGPEEEPSR